MNIRFHAFTRKNAGVRGLMFMRAGDMLLVDSHLLSPARETHQSWVHALTATGTVRTYTHNQAGEHTHLILICWMISMSSISVGM